MIGDEARFVQLLSYGNAEQSFFRRHTDRFDMISLPGTVATYFQQGAGGFVLALTKPYVIDPRTPVLQGNFQRVNAKPRHHRLAEAHGPAASRIFHDRPLRESDLEESLLVELVDSMVEFQEGYAASSSSKIAEYRELLGPDAGIPDVGPLSPEWIVPPYLRAGVYGDGWYQASLRMVQIAQERAESTVVPVICVAKGCLPQMDQIAADYSSDLHTVLLWIDGFDAYRDSPDELRSFLGIVTQLSGRGLRVVNLFGNYFSVLASHLGLAGVGHGVGYGEARRAFAYGGGLPAERYYIPALHRFYPRLDAERILQAVPSGDLACGCKFCAPHTVSGSLDLDSMTREEMLAHFLVVRRREIDETAATPLGELVNRLTSTAAQVAEHLPFGRETRVDHLLNWVQALEH